MTTPSPEVYVTKTDHIDRTGVFSTVTLVVHPEEHTNHVHVHLTADEAQVLSIQLALVAAEVKPELVT